MLVLSVVFVGLIIGPEVTDAATPAIDDETHC